MPVLSFSIVSKIGVSATQMTVKIRGHYSTLNNYEQLESLTNGWHRQITVLV